MADQPESLPPHHSAVRAMSAEGEGRPYRAFATLAEAREHPNTAAIMEGDDGGQIYFTCPVARIICDEPTLQRLLADLNTLSWGDGEGLYFEVRPVHSGVPGGMGGGVIIDGVWLHDEFESAGLRPEVEAVVGGRRDRLSDKAMQEAAARISAFNNAMRTAEQVQAAWSYLMDNDWSCTHCGQPGRADRAYELYTQPGNRAWRFIVCRRCHWPQHLRPQWNVDHSLFDAYCPQCGEPLYSIRSLQCTKCGAHWFGGRPDSTQPRDGS